MVLPLHESPETTPRRRVGRPSKRILSMRLIVDRALEIVTDEGLDSLTMSRLAGALEVTPAALYNHVSSKDEILREVQDRIMGQLDLAGFDEDPWPVALRRWAVSYRNIMAAQPDLIALIALMPINGARATTVMYERVATALSSYGWPKESIVPTIVALESFVFGSAYDALAPANIFELEADADAPVFTAANRAQLEAEPDRSAAEIAFHTGLDALLEGFTKRMGVPWPAGLCHTSSSTEDE